MHGWMHGWMDRRVFVQIVILGGRSVDCWLCK